MLEHERFLRKLIFRILQKLSEGDAHAPRVGLVALQSLDQNARDLFLDGLLTVVEQVEDNPRVEVGVTVNVTEFIHKAVQEAQAGVTI